MRYYQYDDRGVFTGKTVDLHIKEPISPMYTQKEVPVLEDAEIAVFRGKEWLVMNKEDLLDPQEEPIDAWAEIREERDLLLRASDQESFITLPDVWSAKTTEQQNAWLDYRQALRDITTDYNNADDIIWPDKPV